MIYGYVRVSTREQNEDRQVIAMREMDMPILDTGQENTKMGKVADTDTLPISFLFDGIN